MISRTHVENWDTTHLFEAATHWNGVAAQWEDSFDSVHREARMPGGTVFHGATADALRGKTRLLVNTTSEITGHLRAAAHIAQAGEHQLEEARRAAVEAIQNAEADQFDVAEDFAITDRAHPSTPWELESRLIRAGIHQGNIARTVTELVTTDGEVSAGIARSTTGIHAVDFTMGGGHGISPLDGPVCNDPDYNAGIERRLAGSVAIGALIGGLTGGPLGAITGGALGGIADVLHETQGDGPKCQ